MSGFAIHRSIPLTHGATAWVDQGDYEMLRHFNWHLFTARSHRYARAAIRRGGRTIPLLMHRMLMLPDPDQHIDHVNGDGLDNRRRNLRPCTTAQNHYNRHAVSGGSNYKGVHLRKRDGSWRAMISMGNKQHHLGSFADPVDAALAYDVAAIAAFEDFARPNFLVARFTATEPKEEK